jgi:NAD(P)H-dependent FMN reductase
MEPLSATVAAIVTGFLTKGAAAIAQQVGEAASNAAQTLAQAVLDRLKADPLEERTVERYEQDPETQQPAIEAAIKDLVATDEAFAARLQELVTTYREAAGTTSVINVGGDVDGPIVQGDRNVVIEGTSGTVRIGGSADET